MEEQMKGRRSKYSSKQKEAIKQALLSTVVHDVNLPLEEVFEIPIGKPLLPERGFEPLYKT